MALQDSFSIGGLSQAPDLSLAREHVYRPHAELVGPPLPYGAGDFLHYVRWRQRPVVVHVLGHPLLLLTLYRLMAWPPDQGIHTSIAEAARRTGGGDHHRREGEDAKASLAYSRLGACYNWTALTRPPLARPPEWAQEMAFASIGPRANGRVP